MIARHAKNYWRHDSVLGKPEAPLRDGAVQNLFLPSASVLDSAARGKARRLMRVAPSNERIPPQYEVRAARPRSLESRRHCRCCCRHYRCCRCRAVVVVAVTFIIDVVVAVAVVVAVVVVVVVVVGVCFVGGG